MPNMFPSVLEERKALAPTLRRHDRAIRELIAAEAIEPNRRRYQRVLKGLRRVRAGGDRAAFQTWFWWGGGDQAINEAAYRSGGAK